MLLINTTWYFEQDTETEEAHCWKNWGNLNKTFSLTYETVPMLMY